MIDLLVYVATGFAILSLVAGLLFLGYLVATERRAPFLSRSITEMRRESAPYYMNPEKEGRALVSILVAARNEEKLIGKCIESLLAQTFSNTEIIVVDDSSKDRTPDIVSELARSNANLRLVSAGPRPQGWVGKSWPCWRGYEESKGDFLLFVDADSTLSPRALEVCLNYVVKNRIDIFSVSPKVIMRGVWAKSVLPIISGAINLLYPMEKVNDSKSPRAYVFGTFILLKRSVYEATGGHERVKSEIVEDAALARLAKSKGFALRVERAPELLSTEWESEPLAIYHGLERVVSSSIKSFGLISLLDAALLFFVALYPIIFVIAFSRFLFEQDGVILLGFTASLSSIISFLLLAAFELKTVGGRIGVAPLLYPLGAAMFIAAIVSASFKVAFRRRISWKGEGYTQEQVPRENNMVASQKK